jgi:hypothetical protein
MRLRPWGFLVLTVLVSFACARRDAPGEAEQRAARRAEARALADRAQVLVLPREEGAGAIVIERVTPTLANLDLPSPDAEPGEVPPPEPAARGHEPLKPPIARGAPLTVHASGAARVTLDVRVDEQGEVTDVLVVACAGDTLAVPAAESAAFAVRYHPALLGTRPIAVWARQSVDVKRR